MLGCSQWLGQAHIGLSERRDFGQVTHYGQEQSEGRISCVVLQKNGNLAASFQMGFTGLAVSRKKTVTHTCLCTNTEMI